MIRILQEATEEALRKSVLKLKTVLIRLKNNPEDSPVSSTLVGENSEPRND